VKQGRNKGVRNEGGKTVNKEIKGGREKDMEKGKKKRRNKLRKKGRNDVKNETRKERWKTKEGSEGHRKV